MDKLLRILNKEKYFLIYTRACHMIYIPEINVYEESEGMRDSFDEVYFIN